ncbi:sucrose operon repressor ScrR, LacI family [Agrilactobacillus composti DSM 18527 = JCM 14202]|nr:sucrose operon repressor ScrR, LacI family [Agrilactobacillus composti DSM 18527 = JCM 14202]
MTPKLEDVAKLAAVSKTTVSRVLNNRGYLSQKTIDKVHAAMAQLDYHPNVVARQLYKNQTNLIGILLLGGQPFFWRINGYFRAPVVSSRV